ncbi:YadA C-terminal domain-containing protein [Rahnella selenatireducens]|uniref:YadA C-terminal domain-containing protein n=1 Tax=Rahnella selenatireducens TaxID=3389797 RepID=UPI003969468B
MKAQATDRNTQIVNAYVAGNHNKSELARYFGVSASTIRRALTAVAVVAAAVTAAPVSASNVDVLAAPTNVPSQAELKAHFAALKAAQTHEASQDNSLSSLQHDVNWSNNKIDANHHALMVAQVDIDNNAAKNAEQDAATKAAQATATHASINATAALKGNFIQSGLIKANQDAIADGKVKQQATDERQDKATETAQNDIDGANARENIRQSNRIQGMVAAHDAAQTASTMQASIPIVQQDTARLAKMNAAATNAEVHALITQQAADHQTIAKLTATPAQQPVVQQQVRSAYYDAQITTLNAEAEQNHAEVLSESRARYQADKKVLSDSESYTNQKFSTLKSEVDDNKKEAAAGSASAMAQANIPQVQESQQFAVGAGVGGYDSENALSVGASFHAGQATIVKVSVSDDTQDNVGYGAGVSVGW